MKTKSYIEKLKADARAKELDATRSKTSQDKYWQGQQDMASLILAKIKAEITSGNEVDAYLISAAPDMYEALNERTYSFRHSIVSRYLCNIFYHRLGSMALYI